MPYKNPEDQREAKRRWRIKQGMKQRTDPVSRFLEKVDKNGPQSEIGGQCWVWLAQILKGYGRFDVNGTNILAHRFSYQTFKGKIPENKVLDHLCRVRFCVNPDHLEPVSWKENALRGKGPTAINSLKTSCPKCGTPYTRISNGARRCKPCIKEYQKHWYAKKKQHASRRPHL